MAWKELATNYSGDIQTLAAINGGQWAGYSTDFMIGYNPNLTSGTEENIWPLGGVYTWPTRTGEPMELVSTNPLDNQLILIMCLDGDGLQVNDFVTLNGVNPVPLNINPGRINFMLNIDSTDFLGMVLVRGAGVGPTYSVMMPEDQQSHQLVYTIPSNKRGFFLPAESTLNSSGGADDNVRLSVKLRRPGGVFWRAGRWGLQKRGVSAFIFRTADVPVLTPWIDVAITCVGSSSGIDVSGRVPFLLEDV